MAKCYCCGSEFTRDKKHDLYCPKCRERESAKDMRAFLEPYDDNVFTDLLCAMLDNAREDLYKAIRRWHNAEDEEKKDEAFWYVYKEMKWWKSKWFNKLAGELDGIKVLRDLIKFNEDITQEEKLLLEKEIY